MSTGIQWTDETWNPVIGCSRVSEGCRHCYAELQAIRQAGEGKAYHGLVRSTSQGPHWTGVVRLVEDRLAIPLHWRKPRKVFVNSMGDLFHESLTSDRIDAVFAAMALSGALALGHVFQVLTKRAERMREYLTTPGRLARIIEAADRWFGDENGCHAANALRGVLGAGHNVGWPMANVWVGVSVEDQRAADERIPHLLATPAALRFLSCEPLLGPVDLSGSCRPWGEGGASAQLLSRIGWVIVGGESGAQARPCDLRWIASLVAQCKAASVPVFVKQLGAVPMEPEDDWRYRARTRLLNARNRDRVPADFVPLKLDDAKGGWMAEWPAELQVRQFPQGAR